jgi:hypothetical protein
MLPLPEAHVKVEMKQVAKSSINWMNAAKYKFHGGVEKVGTDC